MSSPAAYPTINEVSDEATRIVELIYTRLRKAEDRLLSEHMDPMTYNTAFKLKMQLAALHAEALEILGDRG